MYPHVRRLDGIHEFQSFELILLCQLDSPRACSMDHRGDRLGEDRSDKLKDQYSRPHIWEKSRRAIHFSLLL